jgi:hypothetical protein
MDNITSLENGAFGPETAEAMAATVEEVCQTLGVNSDLPVREIIAIRIIELARRGERDTRKLRDRLLRGAILPPDGVKIDSPKEAEK